MLKKALRSCLFVLLAAPGAACFPGGIIDRGGFSDGVSLLASATLTRGAPYHIVCWDEVEAERRRTQAEKQSDTAQKSKTPSSKRASGQVLGPPIRLVSPRDYRGGCEQEGEHSVFFLMNLFPVTPPINPEYAISTAVQRLEGDTMIKLRIWHEVHYYSILGRVSVFKVRGDVIRFESRATDSKKEDRKDGPR